MANVLVLAEDRCVGFTCAEILEGLGFRARAGAWPVGDGDGVHPDVILAWDLTEEQARLIRAAHANVPLLVCSWAHRQRGLDSARTVQLPFNPARVASSLSLVLRSANTPAQRAA